MTDEAQALAERCAAAMAEGDAATRTFGLRVLEVGPGRARVALEVSPAMSNGHGMCHGGFLFALADTAFAYACNTRGDRVVAAQCHIAFVRPARVGERLLATAEERVVAGRSGIYDVGIATEAGDVVAEFRGHSRTIGPFEPVPATER